MEALEDDEICSCGMQIGFGRKRRLGCGGLLFWGWNLSSGGETYCGGRRFD
jgi:hypothetical protein